MKDRYIELRENVQQFVDETHSYTDVTVMPTHFYQYLLHWATQAVNTHEETFLRAEEKDCSEEFAKIKNILRTEKNHIRGARGWDT